MSSNELCWESGEFNDNCDCECCEHKSECSGYEDHDDIDEE